MNDLISVIVPIYNVEKYLRQCVESIINQTYKNLEIILVDDGSTDSSGTMCDSLSLLDDRVRVIHKENGGLSSARNVGIEEAKGRFISFIDSDDFISTDMLYSLYNSLVETGCKIACCDYLLFENEKEILKLKSIECKYERLNHDEAMINLFSMTNYRFLAWNKLYDKSLFDSIKFPEGKFFEDIWPIYNIFKNVESVTYVKTPLYYYRFRKDSISKDEFSYKDYDLLEFIKMVCEDCVNTYPHLKPRADVAYIFYSLSFVNKAIRSKNSDIKPEVTELRTYVKENYKIIKNDIFVHGSRWVQLFLFNHSFVLYKILYRIMK